MHYTVANCFPIPLTQQYLPSRSFPGKIQSAAKTMQLPTTQSSTVYGFPVPFTQKYLPSNSNPRKPAVKITHHAAPHYAQSYSQQFSNSPQPPISPFTFNPPVTFRQHHTPCSYAICTLLQSTVSQFFSPTNISLPIQSPSNIQSAPLTIQLPTMHSPAVNCFPIPLSHQYLPQHYIVRHPQFMFLLQY